MFKLMLYGALALVLAAPLTSNAQEAKTVNGIKLYQTGNFPKGKMLHVDGLTSLPAGNWQEPVYLIDPIKFIGSGTKDDKGNYLYTGKVDRTWVGGLFVSVTNSAASNSVFKITTPYSAPLTAGSVYKFTSAQPLTVISKESQLNSNGTSFSVDNCTFQLQQQ